MEEKKKETNPNPSAEELVNEALGEQKPAERTQEIKEEVIKELTKEKEIKTEEKKEEKKDEAKTEEKKEEKTDEAKTEEKKESHKTDLHTHSHGPGNNAHHTHTTHHKKPKKKIKIDLKVVNTLLMVVIGALLIFNLSTIANLDLTGLSGNAGSTGNELSDNPAVLPPELGGAEITVTILTVDCDDCYDLEQTLTALRGLNLQLTENEVAYDSEEGKELVEQYNITGVPAVLLKGDIDSSPDLQFLPRTDDSVVLPAVPPYVDVVTGDIKGKVKLTYFVKSDCEDCFDVQSLSEQLSQFGLVIDSEEVIDVASAEGKEAIEKYSLTQVPTFMVSKEIEVYTQLYEAWVELSEEQDDGSLLITEVTPPYYDLETNKVEGLVTMTNLVDESCDECYDVDIHSQILELRFGMKVTEKNTVDVASAEGQELVEKYSIKNVPTIILSEEVSAYRHIVDMWAEIGTEEDDGSFVFRGFEQLGEPYKNLETGEMVEGNLGLIGGAVVDPADLDLEVVVDDLEETVVEEETDADTKEENVDEESVEETEESVDEEEINQPPVLDLGLE